MIYPAQFEEKIGFDRIRGMLAGKCMSRAGQELVETMEFCTNAVLLEQEVEIGRASCRERV